MSGGKFNGENPQLIGRLFHHVCLAALDLSAALTENAFSTCSVSTWMMLVELG